MHIDIHQIRSSAPTWRCITERRNGYLRIIPSDLLHLIGRNIAPEIYANYTTYVQCTTAWPYTVIGVLGPNRVLAVSGRNVVDMWRVAGRYDSSTVHENNTLFLPTPNGVYYAEMEQLQVRRYSHGTTTLLPGGSDILANSNLDYYETEYTCNNGTLFFGLRRCVTWTYPIALLMDDRALLVHPDSGTILCNIPLASIPHRVSDIDMLGQVLYLHDEETVTTITFGM